MHRTLRRAGVTATILALVLSLSACALGDSDQADNTGNGGNAAVGTIPAVTDNGADAEPGIARPDGAAPTQLLSQDLTVGTGAEATADSVVTVHYTGISWSTGETFDSSWPSGQPIEFPLSNLIQGWKEGIPGMKVGGRRVLVIPPALAYGAAPGHPLEKETLVFVIDLKGVK